MKMTALCSGIVAILMVLISGTVFAQPKAVCNNALYNAGKITQGKLVVHDFTIKNDGDQPLTLEVKDCGCGGVKAKVSSSPVKPGMTGTIAVSIPTENRKGPLKREILITTNDPQKKDLIITVTGSIEEDFSINPQYVNLGEVAKNSKYTRDITVSNNGRKPIIVKGVEINPAGIAAITPSIEKLTLNPGEVKKVQMTFSTPNKSGYVEGEITIKTNLKDTKEKKIVIRAMVPAR